MNKPEFLSAAAQPPFSPRYGNFIGGRWVEPVAGRYFENVSPINGRVMCEVARSDAAAVERPPDAAHAAKDAWGRTAIGAKIVLDPARGGLILGADARRSICSDGSICRGLGATSGRSR